MRYHQVFNEDEERINPFFFISLRVAGPSPFLNNVGLKIPKMPRVIWVLGGGGGGVWMEG